MQMFLWNRVPLLSQSLLIRESLVGIMSNAFNPGKIDLPVAPAFIQSDLVLFR
jgi:hypothetical protein